MFLVDSSNAKAVVVTFIWKAPWISAMYISGQEEINQCIVN